jgi:F-box/TPR repeat protein Pof3
LQAEGATYLRIFRQAIPLADGASYALHDSRAAVYEKQNRLKDALRDAKKTIDITPTQWHGYFRSARLFAALNKSSSALRMCSLALERLSEDPKHDGRRRELTALRCQLEARTKCPIAGIPVELLLMVFDLVCRPVALSLVCRRWREIALSHPTLWHSLVLAEPPKKAIHKLQEWRRRSRGQVAALTIRKSLGGVVLKPLVGRERGHPDDLAMRDVILAELRRLDLAHVKTCHLEDVDAGLFLTALWGDICSPSLQCLETLSVSHSLLGYGESLGRIEYSIPSWANIRILRISNMKCHWMAFTVFAPGLTSFEYNITGFPVSFESIRYLLLANPTLEKLIVGSNASYTSYATDSPEPLIMTHLHHVELSSVALSPDSTQNLSLPSLQVLRLSQLPGSALVLENLVDDPGTSFAELVELTMKNCSFETPSLTLALSLAPKLEILQLTGGLDANAVAESLGSPCSTPHPVLTSEIRGLVPTELPILCPSLTVLDLSGSPSLRTGPVMRLVKERLGLAASQDSGKFRLPGQDSDQRVSCIRSLKIDGCIRIEAEMLPWFRKNVPQFSCRYLPERNGS